MLEPRSLLSYSEKLKQQKQTLLSFFFLEKFTMQTSALQIK